MMNEIQNLNENITRIFENISSEKMQNSNSLIEIWKKILLKIRSDKNPNEGRNLADHSRVVDFKNGILLIEADHPGWIELLQFRKKFILTCLNNALPKLNISTLAFKLKGRGGGLAEDMISKSSPELVRVEMEKRISKQEEELGQFEKSFENSGKKEKIQENRHLPPELESIFKDLKESMLTNSKK